jgi:outer membrane protein TolC
MHDKHEPRSEFVGMLGEQIGREIRRRNRAAETPRRFKLGFAHAGLMLVSMGIGAAVAGAAYQAQDNQRRDLLTSGFERQAELARQRLALANEQLKQAEQLVSVGSASPERLLESRLKIAEAETKLKVIELLLQESRITAREPLQDVSGPLVSGRDLIGERLRLEMSVPQVALELERARQKEIEKRVSLGVTEPIEMEVNRARIAELEAAMEAVRRKIEIRQKFLGHKIDAPEAELRVLEGEAEQRKKALTTKIELARKEVERSAQKVRLGVESRVNEAAARVRLQELEAEMARAELDLAVVRRKLQERGAGR